jgi:hypothetical protein
MLIFRWTIGVLCALLAAGAVFNFALFIAFDAQPCLVRARTFRRGVYMALLLWFNVEVWGRVLWTLIHW